MKLSRLIEFFADYEEDDPDVFLSKAMTIDAEDEIYEVVLCAPIIGVFYDNETKELRFMIEQTKCSHQFGEIKRFDGGVE